jgi:hypothetical protein
MGASGCWIYWLLLRYRQAYLQLFKRATMHDLDPKLRQHDSTLYKPQETRVVAPN